MKKRKLVLISAALVLFCLLAAAVGFKIAIRDRGIRVQVNDQIAVPHAHELSGRSGGSYWDSPALSLPRVSAASGEAVELICQSGFPAEVTVVKYDVLNETLSLGAAETRGEPEELALDRQKNRASFYVPEFNTEYQLIRCRFKWKFLFAEETVEYVFTLENKQ